jgi:hypothetical protein
MQMCMCRDADMGVLRYDDGGVLVEQVQRCRAGAECRGGTEVQSRCRGAEMQRCRDAEVQRCRCRDERWRCRGGAEVQVQMQRFFRRGGGAVVQRSRCRCRCRCRCRHRCRCRCRVVEVLKC